MRNFAVIDKSNNEMAIFRLVRTAYEFNHSPEYRFIDLTNDLLLPVKFPTPAKALEWLDIGFAWEEVSY